jgi:hypothetical protein
MMQPGLLQRILRKLDKTLSSPFFIDQWVIMVGRGMDYRSLRWEALTPLMPAKDRYWGDPFVVQRDGGYFVFLEEKLYATGKGRIACLHLDADGRLLGRHTALETDHHLSYPFIFERDGELFMLPESAANRTVDLYRCTRFPDAWEYVRTLMQDVYAVDATLLEHSGSAWLFANVKEQGGSSLNSLHLFMASDPFSSTWRPHPRNPVVRDIASARPAGRVFVQDGQLIRPSQDSSRRYGGALKFNRIAQLDENDYGEETVATFAPRGGRIRATHTFNQSGDMTVIDAVLRRPR